jgi:hypothetical protein
MDTEIVLNICTSKEVADDLQNRKFNSMNIEGVDYTQEQTSRFGLVEIAAIIGVVKTLMDVIKVGLDIRDILKKMPSQTAQLSRSGQNNTYVIIRGSMTNEEIENEISNHFRN